MDNYRLGRSLFSWIAIILWTFSACSNDSSRPPLSPSPELTEDDCSYTITDVENYALIEPDSCNIVFELSDGTQRSKSFAPASGNNPDPEAQDYFFMVREGDPNRLLINFMGGGACWSGTNCLDDVTNYTYDDIEMFSPDKVTAPALAVFEIAFDGIIDGDNPNNPFKDWTLIFLPYTTGDLHWGSRDHEYADDEGNKVMVHHRGFDNFLAVLRYIKDNYPATTIDDIFVAGQSAGSYGAIFTFPYIKEVYPDAMVNMLGDSGAGVNTESFMEDSSNNWNVMDNLPDWVTGIDGDTFNALSMGSMYEAIATYYPESNFAQFTTMYDTNQRFFYNVMLEIDNPDAWRFLDNEGYGVPDTISCDWRDNMFAQKALAEDAPNYRAYIAPGEYHTITSSRDFYTTASSDVMLVDWMNWMLTDDPNWESVVCTDCAPPASMESPEGISCF